MPVFHCVYCGKLFASKANNAKYCNASCSAKAKSDKAYEASRLRREELSLFSCQYNEGVDCVPEGDCSKCGWNPEVARKRFERILAQLLGAEEVLSGGD